MTAMVRQITEVAVNVTQRAVVYTVNTLIQACLRIVAARRLGTSYMEENREVIEIGLATWLVEKTLLRAHLEVFMAGQAEAMERWEFAFSFSGMPGSEFRSPPVDEFGQLCARLQALPRGAQYRIVVETAPNASKVPGWELTELRPLDETGSQTFQTWGYGHLDVSATFRNGAKNR